MAIVTALYGHNSAETAYVVDNYPYGRLQCKMRFWLETKPNKGTRLMMQSQNPKNGIWNKPKAGNYSLVTENLYLDENGHCKACAIHQYSTAENALEFVKAFPQNEHLSQVVYWAFQKYKFLRARVEDKRSFISIGGKECEYSEAERDAKEKAIWWQVVNIAKGREENHPEPEATLKTPNQDQE